MDRRTLQMIQRGLIASVSLVLALVVITAFGDLLEPPETTFAPRTTTTLDLAGEEETTTTTAAATPTTSTTTVTAAPAVCAEEPPDTESESLLTVFFPCGPSDPTVDGTFVYRTVPETDLVLTTTLREMTRGLDENEVELGFRSPFPAAADGSFLGVSIAEGTAFLEFNNDIFPPGVDTAEGARIFLSTLNANVFQFNSINQVEYRLAGSCAAFWQQLGIEGCDTVTRAEWQSSRLAGG